MGKEIERKFLVASELYKKMSEKKIGISQGYLCRDPQRTVRVRTADSNGYITVKGLTRNFTREEYEYEIPFDDAVAMLGLCEGRILHKTRWIIPFAGHYWEVDEFGGDLAGLTVAEVELKNEQETVEFPPFIGEEVTGNPSYYNSNLQ